jgi:hypothetical protein
MEENEKRLREKFEFMLKGAELMNDPRLYEILFRKLNEASRESLELIKQKIASTSN